MKEIQCGVKQEVVEEKEEEEEEVDEEEEGAHIDHPPGVMDSAISGSGQRRRGENDFCFSKS